MKDDVLLIRCSRKTKIRFKRLAAYFHDYEELLNALMDIAEKRISDFAAVS